MLTKHLYVCKLSLAISDTSLFKWKQLISMQNPVNYFLWWLLLFFFSSCESSCVWGALLRSLLFICLSICLFYLFICLCLYLSLSIHLCNSISKSIYLSISQFVCLSLCLLTCLFVVICSFHSTVLSCFFLSVSPIHLSLHFFSAHLHCLSHQRGHCSTSIRCSWVASCKMESSCPRSWSASSPSSQQPLLSTTAWATPCCPLQPSPTTPSTSETWPRWLEMTAQSCLLMLLL